jgi:hypothetical protein
VLIMPDPVHPSLPPSITGLEFTTEGRPSRLILHFHDRFGCVTHWPADTGDGLGVSPDEINRLATAHVRFSAAITRRN